jgi:hypothetical protein
MRSIPKARRLATSLVAIATVALTCLLPSDAAPQTASKGGQKTAGPPPVKIKTFASPEEAANALIAAAEKFDVAALEEMFGPEGKAIIHTGEPAGDRERAVAFAAKAREKMSVDTKTHHATYGKRTTRSATLIVGNEDWPFPVPIIRRNQKWSFFTVAGLREILLRRIGRNELDAIAICRGYVEAQHEYALKPREGYDVNQYAQRIISTPGKQDGLAWQNSDGTWGGPIGENVAKAIEKGYASRTEPYHGYFFKILKGQGPAAPMGQLDFVVKGAMIGGFALIAAPAEYRVTGVKTFMVSHDGVVYEKDFGPNTLELAKKIERFNPDATWKPVTEM